MDMYGWQPERVVQGVQNEVDVIISGGSEGVIHVIVELDIITTLFSSFGDSNTQPTSLHFEVYSYTSDALYYLLSKL